MRRGSGLEFRPGPRGSTLRSQGWRTCSDRAAPGPEGRMTTRVRTRRRTSTTFRRFSQAFSTRPSGISSASRQAAPRMWAAAEASAARSSAEPRVPASPRVRSRMAVETPRECRRQQVLAAGLLHIVAMCGDGEYLSDRCIRHARSAVRSPVSRWCCRHRCRHPCKPRRWRCPRRLRWHYPARTCWSCCRCKSVRLRRCKPCAIQ